MLEQFFGSTANFNLLVLSMLFRIFRALHDGLSERAEFLYVQLFFRQTYGTVGAWPWHLVNWLGRDTFIAILYIYVFFYRNCSLTVILLAISLQYFLHDLFYWWAVTHRHLFNWGKNWPNFPSLFKNIFKRDSSTLNF